MKNGSANLQARVDRRLVEAYSEIQNRTVKILRRDLEREKGFLEAETVEIDFGKDRVSVNNKESFSASDRVILKNSVHLALLAASLLKEFLNYPRFLLLDNVEDKGMEPARSHNFLKLIVDLSNSSGVDHQIIFTTSMIDPELEESELTVGEYYRHGSKCLKLEGV